MNGSLHAADSTLDLSTLVADRPRSIDRLIDYFGEPARPAVPDRGATATARTPWWSGAPVNGAGIA